MSSLIHPKSKNRRVNHQTLPCSSCCQTFHGF